MKKKRRPIYTLDLETDPFQYGRDPLPFAAGLYTGDKFVWTWGDDCVEQMHAKLMQLEPGIIFVHNGGKFDLWFLMRWIANRKQMMIINGRIVRCWLWRNDEAFHELRDSFAIMPFALKTYQKDEIDYRVMERGVRDKNKRKILKYLKGDCVYLHELCVEFFDTFGDNLTIGSTSMKYIKKLHPFECLDEIQDASIRDAYYYGGRVQCFEKGIVKPSKGEKIVAYDINQAYPYVMSRMQHPIGQPLNVVGNEITDRTAFVTVYGRNNNAFPVRTKTGLRFDVQRGMFSVSIHEYRAAIDTGMFVPEDIISTVEFDKWGCFDKFVEFAHTNRREAQLAGVKSRALLFKFFGNSGYGKFAQNPDNYYNYVITDDKTDLNPERDEDGFHPCSIVAICGVIVWRQHSANSSRYNVATGASITGATRSLLIRALANAQRPLYCDTDCIVCERLSDVPIDDTKLGHWKIEKRCTKMAIAGRKMYALFDGKECVKTASKGVHLTPAEIVAVANGKVVTWRKDAPTFNMKTHTATYLERNVKMTI